MGKLGAVVSFFALRWTTMGSHIRPWGEFFSRYCGVCRAVTVGRHLIDPGYRCRVGRTEHYLFIGMPVLCFASDVAERR